MSPESATAGASDEPINEQPPELPGDPLGRLLQPPQARVDSSSQARGMPRVNLNSGHGSRMNRVRTYSQFIPMTETAGGRTSVSSDRGAHRTDPGNIKPGDRMPSWG